MLAAGICGAETTPFQGEITADNTRIRVDSTASAETISLADKGKRVEVISESYDWYKIRLPKNAPAYIKKIFIVPLKDNAGEVEKTNVNVRLRPEGKSPIIGKVNKGELLTILGTEGGWYKIEPPEASFGWVHVKFVKSAPLEPEPAPEIIPEEETIEAGAATDTIKEAEKANVDVRLQTEEKSPAIDKINKTKLLTTSSAEKSWYKIDLEPTPEIILDEEETAEKSAAQITEALSSVEGIVTPYGKVIKRITTHKLTTKDKKIYLLKGDKTLLNSLNYRKVKVEGNLIEYRKHKYPVIEVTKSEVLE